MNTIADRRCGECGKPITSGRFVQAPEDYRCEDCYLQQRTASAELFQADAALAAALATALDLREHETGLHSKRVACHTLELARRCISGDSERLRQIYWVIDLVELNG